MSKSPVNRVSIDQAIEETKFGKFNYFLIIISGLIQINVVVECLGIGFVLPVTKCDMELSYQEKGILAAIGFLGIISSSHLWGFVADTMGRKTVIRPTLLAAYLATVASSFAPNFTSLVLLRFANGFLLSGGSATVFAYLGEFHSDNTRNRAIMASGFISAGMALLLPVVAWAVINQTWSFYIPILDIFYKPWRMFILVIGFLGLVCGICLSYFPESPKYLHSKGRDDEVFAVLKKMYSANTGNDADTYKIKSIFQETVEESNNKLKSVVKSNAVKVVLQSMWHQTVPLFRPEHCRNTLLACFIQFWMFFSAHGLYMWFPYILNKVMRFTSANPNVKLEMCEILYIMENADKSPQLSNSTQTQIVNEACHQHLELSTYQHTFSFEAIYAVLFLGVGYFTGKLGRIPTLFIILMVCGVCGILSATVSIPTAAVYFLQILLVVAIGVMVLNSIIVDIFPTHMRAMAICISLMMGRVGSVFGTNVMGALLENHCKTGLLGASIMLVVNAFLALLLPRKINSRKLSLPSVEAG